eukprot:1031336-Prymnesium_polylepis.1
MRKCAHGDARRRAGGPVALLWPREGHRVRHCRGSRGRAIGCVLSFVQSYEVTSTSRAPQPGALDVCA